MGRPKSAPHPTEAPTEEAEEAVPLEAVAAEVAEADVVEVEVLVIQTTHRKTHANCTGNSGKEVGHVLIDITALGETSRALGQGTTETFLLQPPK